MHSPVVLVFHIDILYCIYKYTYCTNILYTSFLIIYYNIFHIIYYYHFFFQKILYNMMVSGILCKGYLLYILGFQAARCLFFMLHS